MIEYITDFNGNTLHIVYKPDDDINDRVDIVEPDEFIQVSYMNPRDGKEFKPHYHLIRTFPYDSVITQETWIVMNGCIEASYYDCDNVLICRRLLYKGDCTITIAGAHSYKSMRDDTFVYEIKNGPYIGCDNDKEYF